MSAKGARQVEPGATPQELDYRDWDSAESAIQSLQRDSQVIRAFSVEFIVSMTLGRCPRLQVIAAPLALSACMRK